MSVLDPQVQSYNIDATYYVDENSEVPLSQISANVTAAVEQFKKWQSAKFDRDVNPAQLIALIMNVEGVKRVVVEEPSYTHLPASGSNTPYIAQVGTTTITNGGYEDE